VYCPDEEGIATPFVTEVQLGNACRANFCLKKCEFLGKIGRFSQEIPRFYADLAAVRLTATIR
ncbi:MAG: hypothetical protein ACUVTH_14760, partial [Thermogutta sp.]